ncbi:DUF2911 domain-containing protein [Flavobacterium caeni]|uniref:DUF2911 domain-containing protein n=1 Tax=Flavobacterium caeni TaxID=490189 RepID=A0A1G5DA04_9FLAO|nr:DUF2911 domain-containing protein [Flavobacterium caeni]SCY11444.1 Protein of unknown function [Flavobacterium caeni]
MKFKIKITAYLLTLFVSVFAAAQEKKSPATVAKGAVNGAEITIHYSSPSVKGREIWGKLVPFGKVWRAGADEATTLETSKEILFGGQKLPAGKYAFFVIPEKDQATIILNKEHKQWGAYDYDQSKDQLRVRVKPQAKSDSTEKLTYLINKDNITLAWEKWNLVVPVEQTLRYF